MSFLLLHDADGDPIYIKNDVLAVFTHAETETIGSMLQSDLVTVRKGPVLRVVLSKSTGRWEVLDSYEEILDQIEAVPCA